MKARPPAWSRALLGRLSSPSERDYVLADLDEAFARIAEESGVAAARRWYRGQALRSLPLLSARLVDLARGSVASDLRGAIRVARRRPLYAAGVAGTLGLGLSSAIVLGGIAWRVWLRPLPFPDSEQLVRIYELGRPDEVGARDRGRISPPLLRDLRETEWTHFTGFAALSRSSPEWELDGELQQLQGLEVSPGFFDLMGMVPLLGRASWDSRNNAEVPEVVLSEAFWRRSFGGDPAVIERSIDLGGRPHAIRGVVRLEGGYPTPVDLLTPLVFEDRRLGEGMRGARYLEVVGRLGPQSTLEAASAEFAAFIEALGPDHPMHRGWTGEAVSLRDDLTGPFRDVLRLLLAAGVAFLALALVNVVGLASIRTLERRHEIGVRLALGASAGRVARGAWVEGAFLGAVGGAGALVVALVLLPASIDWLPPDLARSSEVGLSWGGALLWWIGSVGIGGVVGLLGHRPAPAHAELRTGMRSSRGGARGAFLVSGQLALTTLLVAVGTLVFERSRELASHDVGFRADHVYTSFVSLPRTTHDDWEARRDGWGAMLDHLEGAGIVAALTTNPPMSGANANYGFRRPGAESESFGQYSIVSPDYFRVMGIPILHGRTFEPGEAGPVTLISETLAEGHFPGEDPVGQTVSILQEEHTVIGVVGPTSHFGPDAPPPPSMYVSFEATTWAFAHLVAQGEASVAERLVDAITRIAPGASPPIVNPYETYLSDWFRPLRIQLGIVGVLGIVGGVLAGLGLYTTVAFQVRGRLPELGIRVALGATRGRILSSVVRGGLIAAGVGLAVGLGGWWASRGALGEVLGTPGAALSPSALTATVALILVLSLTAVALPALRASRADPVTTLRSG